MLGGWGQREGSMWGMFPGNSIPRGEMLKPQVGGLTEVGAYMFDGDSSFMNGEMIRIRLRSLEYLR